MSAVGFEPTRIAPPELESGALDRSAKLTSQTLLARRNQLILILRFQREPRIICARVRSLTAWPSGLRRQLKALVRKSVGSNPTAVIFARDSKSAKIRKASRRIGPYATIA